MYTEFIIKIVGAYFLAVNIITFSLFTIDKWKAIHGRWRIQENVLLGLSLIGGAIGGLLSMHIFHHKTQKRYFAIGLPLMIVIHLAICAYIIFNKNILL